MVITCSAPGCVAKKDATNSKSSVQFHRFPLRKPDVLAKWVKAMKCANFKPTVTSYLCSAHFANSDYETKPVGGIKHLKPTAVPTYFEKKRPGRKKKVIAEKTTALDVKMKSDEYGKDSDLEENQKDYIQTERDKRESNLAEIIGDREKGTLQVLIVGEDGKITNSEYIFKKEIFPDADVKPEPDFFAQDNSELGDENFFQDDEKEYDRNSEMYGSSEVMAIQEDDKRQETLKKLETHLTLSRRKIKFLQMQCNKLNKQNKELKFLLKLLVLKRGRGEKNLDQLLEEYERYEYEDVDVDIKEEFYTEN